MASLEAMALLERDRETWNEFNRSQSGIIDLTGADLGGRDLRGFSFDLCDFSTASLENVNLDGARITNSNMMSVSMVDASLVDCHLTSVTIIHANLNGAVLRRAALSSVRLGNLTSENLFVGDCRLHRCTISDARLDGARLSGLEMTESRISECTGERLILRQSRLIKCELWDLVFSSSEANDCDFAESALKRFAFTGRRFLDNSFERATLSHVTINADETRNLNLTSCSLNHLDLSCLDLPTAILLDAAITGCQWPEQRGRVALAGAYLPSRFLLRQPVGDIKGVPPLIRRDIADAQYLVNKVARAANLWRRFILRAWGAISAYGQSLTRLAIWSSVVIALNAFLLLVSTEPLARVQHHPDLIVNAVELVGRTFVGIGLPEDDVSRDAIVKVILAATNAEGFLALGFWISIASRNLSRLSNE